MVRASLPTEVMGTNDTVRSYKDLAQVERSFRSMKTVDLHVRPIYHHLEDRVRVCLTRKSSCRRSAELNFRAFRPSPTACLPMTLVLITPKNQCQAYFAKKTSWPSFHVAISELTERAARNRARTKRLLERQQEKSETDLAKSTCLNLES